mmetsp:Transcript_13204/g.34854  ORF Transcript_13204/g.34854 Transcript_13204/m.34854 type:complete len:251 (-) Transcript_13204:269-1021(-)
MSRLTFSALTNIVDEGDDEVKTSGSPSSTHRSASSSADRACWLSLGPARASNQRACCASASTRSSGNFTTWVCVSGAESPSSCLRLSTTRVCVSSALSPSWQAYCASATSRSSRKSSSLSGPLSSRSCASLAWVKWSTAIACCPRCTAILPRPECTRTPREPMSPRTSRPTRDAFVRAASALSRRSSARCTVPSAMRMSTCSLWHCASSKTPPMFASRALARWSRACLWYPPWAYASASTACARMRSGRG